MRKVLIMGLLGLSCLVTNFSVSAETKLPDTVNQTQQMDLQTLYTTTNVNLRSEPTTDSKVVRVLSRCTKVHVIGVDDGWYETTTHKYISADYLSDEKPPEYVYSVTDEERYWLYQLVYAEAGTQSYICKKCIASVVFNLMSDSRYPNTVKGVIFNGNAFSPTLDGSIYSKTPDASTKQAVDEVIKYGSITTALYFKASNYYSDWHNQQTYLGQVDDVQFYR